MLRISMCLKTQKYERARLLKLLNHKVLQLHILISSVCWHYSKFIYANKNLLLLFFSSRIHFFSSPVFLTFSFFNRLYQHACNYQGARCLFADLPRDLPTGRFTSSEAHKTRFTAQCDNSTFSSLL